MSLPTESTVLPPDGSSDGLVNSINDLPQEQVDAIIRNKRKAREPKACYPCHYRKVKCDRKKPCDGCIKRGHADFCTYERPAKRRQATTSANSKQGPGKDALPASTPERDDGKMVVVPGAEWERMTNQMNEMQSLLASIRDQMERIIPPQNAAPPPRPLASPRLCEQSCTSSPAGENGIFVYNETSNMSIHVGSQSILAQILRHPNLSKEVSDILMQGNILLKLGLVNESAAYPFVDFWSDRSSKGFDIGPVCNVLPADDSCRKYVHLYCENTSALYPVIPDVPQFKRDLEHLLQARRELGYEHPAYDTVGKRPWRTELDSLALIFAVIAVGSLAADQTTKHPDEARKGIFSRVFVYYPTI
ncbi:hypothetical protein KEM56_005225 [Ascosphaera pollenicola]|nr:hypothetical protein KEM56_005225 [Ascosphaera pollenicola]